MDPFDTYLDSLPDSENKERLKRVLTWVSETFCHLEKKVAWNQPMFTDHGTFIIAFSMAKKHMAVAPEKEALDAFEELIEEKGYERSKELLRLPWDREVPFDLLERIIAYNIEDKAECTRFWRLRKS